MGSVTRWLRSVEEGDQDAAAHLWDRYFRRLAGVVRCKMEMIPRSVADESDMALSAFHSFCRCAEEGRTGDLRGRDEFWKFLVVVAKCKAVDWIRHETAVIRGGGRPKSDAFLEDLVSPDPTPEFTAELLDEVRHLLDKLREEDGTLRLIAVRKLEGARNSEIAAELSCATRTVDRKARRIRILWAAELEKQLQRHQQ